LYVVIGVIVVVAVLVGVGASTGFFGLLRSSSSTTVQLYYAPLPASILAVDRAGLQTMTFDGAAIPTCTSSSCPTGVTLQGDGAQIAAPLLSAWASAYSSQDGNQVNYPASGSGTGLTHFTDGSIDFAITDDPLTPAERAEMPAQPLTLPFVGGALTIIYNLPGLSGHLNLTGALLADIYNGTVTQWNDPAIQSINPGVTLPAATIYTVHRSDAAGTTYVLSDFLSQSSPYWAAHVGKGISISFPSAPKQTAEKGNSLMISTVAANPDSIGYSDLTDVLASASQIQYASVQNPSGHFVVPTLANTISAIDDKVSNLTNLHEIPTSAGDWFNVSMVNANGSADYPIATFIYMFVYQATDHGFAPTLAKSEVLVQWLEWTLTTGQAMADETPSG
jgi:phosphate transport system substrate-binding protein